MATTTTKPDIEMADPLSGIALPAWPSAQPADPGGNQSQSDQDLAQKPSQRDALHALLAFSALHDQVRRRKALTTRQATFDSNAPVPEFEPTELFILDEVLQLVAERAVAITGADGLAVALAENNEIVLRAAAGTVRPDVGARIDRDSAFSGACFRTAQIVNCDDTETDTRVNLQACRKLGARSMVAVPLCGRRRVIGVLEAFSAWPFAFNEIDIRNLSLLAELVLAALKPEDEDRFALSAQVAATKLEPPQPAVTAATAPGPAKPPMAVPVAAQPAKPAPTTPAPLEPAKLSAPTTLESAKFAMSVAAAKVPPAEPVKTATSPAAQKPLPVPAAASEVPAPSPKTAPQPVVALAAEAPSPLEANSAATVVEPQLTFGQLHPEESSHRPWMLFMLVGIVIATAFAVGLWWKLKTAQLGGAIVHSEPVVAQPNDSKAAEPAATDANPATVAVSDSGPSEADASPANPQELAKFPRVTGVRHWSSADSSTVVLDLEEQVQYEPGHLSNPERFYFDLRDTQLAPELQGKSLDGDALLGHIRVAQPVSGMTRVVLEARGSTTLAPPRVSLERDPYRLVIQVSKAGVTPKGAVNLFPSAPEQEKARLAIVVPPPSKEDLQLRARVAKMRIVVDAGHGGWDLGTVGRRGLLEKDLVLEIAQRLGKLLETRLGADVLYTRQDDNYIPLDERAVIANQAHADLFVSVHANYSDLPSARGVETYYTNFFSAPGSKDLSNPAGPKEAAMRSTPKNIPMPTLTPAELHDRVEQSRRLATTVQRSLYGTLSGQNPGLRDRGIKEAGFVVLTESAMPGILAEVSFVSSPTDEQKLRSDGYREQIAEALYKGIARYAASKGVKVASAAK
ncbi:MAG TPA: N-acetylmuramoyl-L-alanine amidase [Candidatus Dormibacteraeota bacterium]|nr:N-acetylmuramoyl-L-alanine amidase [Candidatus Dormibacteraeota bacterium]